MMPFEEIKHTPETTLASDQPVMQPDDEKSKLPVPTVTSEEDIKVELNGNVYDYGAALYNQSANDVVTNGHDATYMTISDNSTAFTNPLYDNPVNPPSGTDQPTDIAIHANQESES